MGKKLAIAVVVCIVLVASLIATWKLLPRHYLVADRLSQATVFWNDKEAFVFLDLMKAGRVQNAVQQKIASHRWGLLLGLYGFDFTEQNLVAFRLSDSGSLERFTLPAGTTPWGKWTLVDGKLQLTPTANPYRNSSGFRWDGSSFQSVPAEAISASTTPSHETLSEDDADDEDAGAQFLIADKEERKKFKNAGWHWKTVPGYARENDEATLPMAIGSGTFNLTLHAGPRRDRPDVFDLFGGGTYVLELSGDGLANSAVLWKSGGWQPVSKGEYEQHVAKSGRQTLPPTVWIWMVLALLLLGWKVFAWAHTIYRLFTVKKRVLKTVPTTYSFPPAVPAQFPGLDIASLERYTREWESLGFERLLDTAPVSDGQNHPATFCRLLVHPRHHCFAQAIQMFPKGKAPMEMRNALVIYLQDGWSVGFSDRKPLPGSTLMRRPKAIGVSMPAAKSQELLQSLLTLSQQVCLDLGISPLTDDTVEGYAARTQETAKDIQKAITQRNFITGIPEYYYRKLGLMRTKPEYVWLGDYPKLAQRKKSFEAVPVG